jgi:hypothetical protein
LDQDVVPRFLQHEAMESLDQIGLSPLIPGLNATEKLGFLSLA